MTAKRLVQDGLPMTIDAVNLEHIFRQVQANTSDLHDGSPSIQLTADRNPRREGGVHTIGAPSSRVWLRLCERIGCGHVFDLLARETNVPLALMLVRMALRPISKTRSLWRLPFSSGFRAKSVGSHRFAVALDADRLAAKPRSC